MKKIVAMVTVLMSLVSFGKNITLEKNYSQYKSNTLILQ